jgi:hypothetical protein
MSENLIFMNAPGCGLSSARRSRSISFEKPTRKGEAEARTLQAERAHRAVARAPPTFLSAPDPFFASSLRLPHTRTSTTCRTVPWMCPYCCTISGESTRCLTSRTASRRVTATPRPHEPPICRRKCRPRPSTFITNNTDARLRATYRNGHY